MPQRCHGSRTTGLARRAASWAAGGPPTRIPALAAGRRWYTVRRMNGPNREQPVLGGLLAGLLAAACAVFVTGVGWGLPSRRVDPYLFGDHAVWTGSEIQDLARN